MPTALRPDLPTTVDDVFARVLAKNPGDRYASCREFIEAIRVALGDLAAHPRTLVSLGDRTVASQASGMAGGPAPRLAGVPTQQVAAASQAMAARQSDPTAARRHEPGGAPPGLTGGTEGRQSPPGRAGPRQRWFTRPRWIAALVALALVAAGTGAWALVSGGSGSHPRSTAMPPASAAPKPKQAGALMSALLLANQSSDAKGLLPPSSCSQRSATMVTCATPVPGIATAAFRTYPSLNALYAAYAAQVRSLNSGTFRTNFQDCNNTRTYGEIGWNHQFVHTKSYSVQQMITGMTTDNQVAGRVFCTYKNGQEYMAWTQDDGHLLAWVAGPVHADVFNWWVNLHHNIGFNGSHMHM